MTKHALVIGGTGMLRDISLLLLNDFDTVSVLARNKSGFESLLKAAGKNKGKINSLKLDYNNYKELTGAITNAVEKAGNISLVISWVHSTAPLAGILTAKIINETSPGCDFYELLGSAYADPKAESKNRKDGFSGFRKICYRKIILGFIDEGSVSRWLSHAEITSGITKALMEKNAETIIGVLEPWEKRP